MQIKVTTLSPIHISSGVVSPGFLYHEVNNQVCRYRFEDVLKNVGNHLTSTELLKLPLYDSKSKKEVNHVFLKYGDYELLNPLYSLENSCISNYLDIDEQMKSLNKPYIPGSSIKGAIMNSIMYHMLYHVNSKTEKIIDKIGKLIQNFNHISPRPRNLEQIIYTAFSADPKRFREAFTMLSSCIICEDIYFDQNSMVLCIPKRINMKNNKPNQFSNFECIDLGQIVEGNFISIDQNRVKLFENNYPEEFKKLKVYLSMKKIAVCLRKFYGVCFDDDHKYFTKHEDQVDIHNDFFPVRPTAQEKNIIVLRIGNSTNYFYKSVAMLVKQKYPKFYENNFQLFSPAPINKKNSPKPDSIPNTRVILERNGHDYLAGLIKFEFID